MKPQPDYSTPQNTDPSQTPFAPTTLPKTSGVAIASLVLGITSIIPTCLGPLIGVILGIVAIVQIGGSQGQFKGTGLAITGIILSLVLGLVVPIAVLLPAVQAVRSAARKVEDSNNVRGVIIATHNYESAFKTLPPTNNQTEEFGAGLSWRVHLLPYLNQQQLFDQFKTDEPWDSPHNIKLLPQLPDVYRSLSNTEILEEGHTLFQRPMGPFAIDDGQGSRVTLSRIRDGTSNTAMIVIVEPSESVPWTKPDDYHFDPNSPKRGLAVNDRNEILVGMADGSIKWIPYDTPPDVIAAIMTANAGDVVDWNQTK